MTVNSQLNINLGFKMDFLRDLVSTYTRMHRIPVEDLPTSALENKLFAKIPHTLKS